MNSDVPNGHDDNDDKLTTGQLREELKKLQEEKDGLETQHRNLLAKVSTMRNTLGAKLKQDAEELDRQEQLLQQLTAERDDLSKTVDVLQQELEASHKEVEDTNMKYDNMRNRMQVVAQETMQHERDVRDLQNQLEQCRLDRDEWKRGLEKEKVVAEEVKAELEDLWREMELVKSGEQAISGELEKEREKARNLQSVLQDFQAAKDHELRQAIKDHESQLVQATQSLAEYKSRALNAELQLEESQSSTSRTQQLEKELKEKNLLIGKLRHEAVIMNEHLIEALRRLRRSTTETKTAVDSTLVTNILLSFLTTPRTDTKRFEILTLLGSVLNWGEEERERAGLQRSGNGTYSNHHHGGGVFWGSGRKSAELAKTDETESFSRLWVEFLLKEASSGEISPQPPPSATASTSLPGSPKGLSFPSDLSPPPARRLASLGAAVSVGMASSPNLVGGKGKGRAGE